MTPITPPFQWFGGKRRVASRVWQYIGNPRVYVEPFAGSLAVLLARPWTRPDAVEIVGDADYMVANFWRSVRSDPEAVAAAADYPPVNADLTARHLWLMSEGADILRAHIPNDPYWHDPQIAGWWWWGLTLWYGHGWMNQGCIGTMRTDPAGPHAMTQRETSEYLSRFADRLRHVHIISGDWRRAVAHASSAARQLNCQMAAFLDPPYASDGIYDRGLYAAGCRPAGVVEWCREHEHRARIILCGYAGDYDLPGWSIVRWSGARGMSRASENRHREAMYLSPLCIPGTLDVLGGWNVDAATPEDDDAA